MVDEPRYRSEYEEQAPWSNLPSLALEKIYSFLSRGDRVNMSLVSPNWSDEFELPSLWRNFRFTMTSSRLSEDNSRSLMNCVRKYSKYFKHVRVVFERSLDEEELVAWSKHFKEFLQILTNTSQIVSIKFGYLGKYFDALDMLKEYSTCKSMCLELDHFFRSQRNFKRLEFYFNYFDYKYGVQLLENLFRNCKNSLQTLVLQDYFYYTDEEEPDSTVEELLPSILSLPNLSVLEIDYRLIFGKEQAILSDVLQKLSSFRKDTYLKILTDLDHLTDSDDFKLLTSSDWRHLKREYPKLYMYLTIDTFSACREQLESSIMEHMPISDLSFNYGYRKWRFPLDVEIDEFLNHVTACKISNDLVTLTLEWSKPIPDVASVFIPFLEVSNKLKTLELTLVYPSNQLDFLLESLLNNKPQSLEEFKLTVWKVEKEQVKLLRDLGSEFECRLKAVKLNVQLLVEQITKEDRVNDEDEILLLTRLQNATP